MRPGPSILCILSIHVNSHPVVFPPPPPMCPPDGDWQLQVPPGAPGTARQGSTRNIIVFTNDGGIATQPKAPGADVPLATTAEAPGQYCLRAAHQAPGHERPFTASTGAAKHGRPRAAPRSPGADVPPATMAEAPGQYCLRAAHQAPGHERPFTASTGAAKHGRPRAAPRAPGTDVPLATVAGAPGPYRPRAVAIATVALPAGAHRLRQEGLPHTPANPRTLTYSCSYRIVSSLQCKPQSSSRPVADHGADSPSLPGKGPGVRSASFPTPPPLQHLERGPGGEARPTTHQAHPAIQVPPHPRSCSTARTGFPLNHPARAPPPRHCGTSRNPAAQLNTAGVLPGSVIPVTARYPPLQMSERGRG